MEGLWVWAWIAQVMQYLTRFCTIRARLQTPTGIPRQQQGPLNHWPNWYFPLILDELWPEPSLTSVLPKCVFSLSFDTLSCFSKTEKTQPTNHCCKLRCLSAAPRVNHWRFQSGRPTERRRAECSQIRAMINWLCLFLRPFPFRVIH